MIDYPLASIEHLAHRLVCVRNGELAAVHGGIPDLLVANADDDGHPHHMLDPRRRQAFAARMADRSDDWKA